MEGLDTKEIKHLYLIEKLSMYKIGLLFDVSKETIRKYLMLEGVKLRKPGGVTQDLCRDDLERLYVVEKLTAKQVSKKLGVSEPVILKSLRGFGLPVRQGGIKKGTKLGPKKEVPQPEIKVNTNQLLNKFLKG